MPRNIRARKAQARGRRTQGSNVFWPVLSDVCSPVVADAVELRGYPPTFPEESLRRDWLAQEDGAAILTETDDLIIVSRT